MNPITFERKGVLSASKWSYRVLGFRAPKKGEYYLSGAIPKAYLAPNDLTTPFHIVEAVAEYKLRQVWVKVS
jgi:hypothetical protein